MNVLIPTQDICPVEGCQRVLLKWQYGAVVETFCPRHRKETLRTEKVTT